MRPSPPPGSMQQLEEACPSTALWMNPSCCLGAVVDIERPSIIILFLLPSRRKVDDYLLLTTRQQLEEAEEGPIILACTSTAPQLKLAGWA